MPEEYKEYLSYAEDGTMVLNTEKWANIEDKEFQFEVLDYAFEYGGCVLKF